MPALNSGTIESFASGNGQVMAYIRRSQDNKALVVHNLSSEEQTVDLAAKERESPFQSLSKTTDDRAALDGKGLTLPPYTTVILGRRYASL